MSASDDPFCTRGDVVNASVPLSRRVVSGLSLILLAACGGPGSTATPGPGPAPRVPQPIAYQPLTEGLPPIPAVDAPLAIRVIQPGANDARPSVDSTFVYGSVGTGDVALLVNGVQVPVAPNGAFIAYLPLPQDGAWRLEAFKGRERAATTITYRAAATPTPPGTAAPTGSTPEGAFPAPLAGVVTGGADTLATGSDAVYARPTPTGTYRWFFPRGARLTLLERRRAQYRVQLDTATAWIDTTAVRVQAGASPSAPAGATMQAQVVPVADGAELRVASGFAPFLVNVGEGGVTVTVYRAGAAAVQVERNEFVTGATMAAAGAGASQATVSLARGAWGYKAFYRPDGTLVVRIRQPPRIDAGDPLRGMRIVVDPGHPPAGATGPTGLYEGDANLAIGLRLAERLRAGGAEVILTRTTDAPLELAPRVEMAVDRDAHLLVSVHNNAFGEGQNPFRAHHTSTYYFHPFSRDAAAALVAEIAPVVRIPNRGALFGNLALARPTWMPSVLTESLFMPIPEQENALRDPQFVERLAEAHARGIEAFFRARAGR
ncbi:MAG TPA: N-acetylmuramoyl-L-alanine amidase [Longimicrobium sp.]|nr:N-acetylmuramoyl-L-alanine amidase [Longimicrobium sp.]